MSEPTRWLDDSRAPDGAASLLRAARPAKPIDAAVQARSAAKLAELVTATAATSTAATSGALFTLDLAEGHRGHRRDRPRQRVGRRAPRASRARAATARGQQQPRGSRRPAPRASRLPAPPRVERTTTAPIAAPRRPLARPPRVTRELARETTPATPEPTPLAPAPRAEVAASLAAREAPHAIVGAASTGERPSTLVEETELLAGVSSAVEPDPAAARRLLDDYRARFTRSRLAPERDYLAFEIARRQGALDEARALGEAFLREHPRSPHASAVRARLSP